MRTNGQLCKCDRCGATYFVKLLKTGDMDGGFSHWEKFEEAPGWATIDGMELCCKCHNEYLNMVARWKNKIIEDSKKQKVQS